MTGNWPQGRSYGVGYDKVHVAVVASGFREAVDATRLAYVEVLADDQKPAMIGFLSCAVAWFNGQGIECHRRLATSWVYGTSKPGHTRPRPTARPRG
jgi:hypothetical protein